MGEYASALALSRQPRQSGRCGRLRAHPGPARPERREPVGTGRPAGPRRAPAAGHQEGVAVPVGDAAGGARIWPSSSTSTAARPGSWHSRTSSRSWSGTFATNTTPRNEPARRLLGGVVEVDGLLNIEDFAEETGVVLPEGPYETVAGFVVNRLGHLPRPARWSTSAGAGSRSSSWTVGGSRAYGSPRCPVRRRPRRRHDATSASDAPDTPNGASRAAEAAG